MCKTFLGEGRSKLRITFRRGMLILEETISTIICNSLQVQLSLEAYSNNMLPLAFVNQKVAGSFKGSTLKHYLKNRIHYTT